MINILQVVRKSNSFYFPRLFKQIGKCNYSSDPYNYNDPHELYRKIIGNRECVGFGINGEPQYFDRADFPFPSLRYSQPTSEFLALREKERGDWRLLTLQEKKQIYRFNFCQTFAEFQHPTGEWMYITGMTFLVVSFGIWLFILMKLFVYSQITPPMSQSESWQKEALRRLIQLHNGPVTGIASKWDYEHKRWKKKPWYIPWEDPFGPDCEE